MGCVLFRDADYGALAVISEDTGVVTVDHGFAEDDFDTVLTVLESHASKGARFRDDGSAYWPCDSHVQVVLASVAEALAGRGYRRDSLGARVLAEVSEDEARSPALPVLRETQVNEAVERGVRRHLEVVVSVLSERGDYTPASVEFLRQQATDHFGRALPFVRMRGILSRPVERVEAIEEALRESLSPVKGSVVRASVESVEEGYAIEVALAPGREVVTEYCRGRTPTFESQAPIQGVRVARFVLNGTPSREEVKAVEERAVGCTAATSIAFPNPRTIVARVPSTVVEGDAASDSPFSARLGWLSEQFREWEPELDYIGPPEPILRNVLAAQGAQA